MSILSTRPLSPPGGEWLSLLRGEWLGHSRSGMGNWRPHPHSVRPADNLRFFFSLGEERGHVAL